MAQLFGFIEMDDDTTALIIQLQKDDLTELIESKKDKGKGREGELSDLELAYQLELDEMQAGAMLITDRKLTQSIARAVLSDAELLATLQQQENIAAADRVVALSLNDAPPRRMLTAAPQPLLLTSSPSADETDDDLDPELIDKLSALYVEAPPGGKFYEDDTATEFGSVAGTDVDGSVAESSSWALTRTDTRRLARRQCIICMDYAVFYDVALLSCGHECCRDCLVEMFKNATASENNYPPRCCGPILLKKNIRVFLNKKIMERLEEKKLEWDTKDRTYCCNRGCGAFIRPDKIVADLATCTVCTMDTCAICKEAAHTTEDCTEDRPLQQTLAYMTEQGFRRCVSCRRGIELRFGCNHMTCPCGAQFCYNCGVAWKTCHCAQWREDRLLERAEVVARRDGGGLAAAVDVLDQDDCPHNEFMRVRGSHDCEECNHTLMEFILQCTRCRLQLCRRCRADLD